MHYKAAMEKKAEQITFRCAKGLKARIARAAAADGRKPSAWLERAIEAILNGDNKTKKAKP